MDLSIIIPIYNVESYIEKCITSLTQQKGFKNLSVEIILINDGSTDSSALKAMNVLKKTSIKWKIIDQENRGVSAARNQGIKKSIGKYIYFIDSDDFVSATLFSQIEKYIRDEHDLIFWGYNHVKSSEEELLSYNSRAMARGNRIMTAEFLFKESLNNGIYGLCIGNVVYKRKLLVENHILFNEDSINGEDREFIFKSLIASTRVMFLNEILFFYVVRSTSISNNFKIKKFDSVASLNNIVSLIRKKHPTKFELLKDMRIQVIDNYFYNLIQALHVIPINKMPKFKKSVFNKYPELDSIINEYEIDYRTKSYKNNIKFFLYKNYFILFCLHYRYR